MQAPFIEKYKADAEFFIEERCYINELSNSDVDEDVSIARARVEPGVTTHWHRLEGITERYVILQGEAVVEVGELPPQHVAHGDVVIIPHMTRQRITNTGEDELVFLAICTPRFQQQFYQDLEQT